MLLGLLVLGLASALFVVRRPLMMSAPRCMAGQWHGCFDTFNGVVLMTLVALPLAVLVVWALALRRRAAACHVGLADVAGGGGHGPRDAAVPVADHDAGRRGRHRPRPGEPGTAAGPGHDGALGIVGNLLVFASLGFFAPMRCAALASLPRILALGAGCSALVETAQYVLRLDRVSSVDDVLVNATGAVLAGLASRRWWRTTAEAPSDRPRPAPATGRLSRLPGGHTRPHTSAICGAA